MGAAPPHRESSKDRKPRFHCSNSAHCAHLLSSSTQADVDVPFNPRPERRRRRCAVTSDRPCSTSLSIEAAPVTRPRRRGAKPDPASTPAKVREDKTRRSKYIADRHPLEDDSLHAPVRADRQSFRLASWEDRMSGARHVPGSAAPLDNVRRFHIRDGLSRR